MEYVTIDLPHKIDFKTAFAYLVESFYAFNIHFPPTLRVFYNFVMMNIFGVDEKSKKGKKKDKIKENFVRATDFLNRVEKQLENFEEFDE